MKSLRLQARARQDAIDIACWIGLESTRNADRFGFALEKTYEAIAATPEAWPRLESTEPRLAGARWRSVSGFRAYLVFYRVGPNSIEILRVLHGSRDLPTALLDP